MRTFTIFFRINKRLFLLMGFMFLFQNKIFSQSSLSFIYRCQQTKEYAEKLIGRPKILFNETDLCEAAKKGKEAATLLSRDSFFSTASFAVQHAGKDRHEHSITFGRNLAGKISTSSMIEGDTTNGKVSSNWPGAFADIHNHTNDLPPSAGDLYYLVKLNSRNYFYDTRFVVTVSGVVYALYVYDLNFAMDFVSKYPSEQTPGFSPRFPEPIFDDVDKISIYFEGQGSSRLIAQEKAMAFVLAKYNSGAVLLKQDNEGNFKTLQTEEMISNGVKIYVANDCK